MALADELERLAQLRAQGVLSEDEFQRAKAKLLGSLAPAREVHEVMVSDSYPVLRLDRLRRSRTDRWLGGVCGGLGQYSGWESWLWRLGFAALFFLWGTGLLFYILLWIFVPEEDARPPAT